MSKLVLMQYDTNCYDSFHSQTCLTFSESINMIRIDTIFKHDEILKNLAKWHKESWRQSDSLDHFEEVERSKNCNFLLVLAKFLENLSI